MTRARSWTLALLLSLLPQVGATESGLITKPSKYSASETIQRFEAAIKKNSANGWMVFAEVDHAAAAAKSGLTLLPCTVIVFGNPGLGTPSMQKAPTLGIDVPPKALVWQDGEGKVWLTYNSGDYLQSYVYPRHGLPTNPEGAKALNTFLENVAREATE